MADIDKIIAEKLSVAKEQRHLAKQNNHATGIKTANDRIDLLEELKKEIGDATPKKSSSKSKSKKGD